MVEIGAMIGMFKLRPSRLATSMLAGGLLIVAALLGILYLWSPHATLRITTGPAGGLAQRFISAFISVTTAAHPRIRFETVDVSTLKASAKALEDGKVDIAIVRSDLPPPVNGQTLVILRRDVVGIILPQNSPIKDLVQLSGKTIAIPAGPLAEENSHALDLLLGYYNVAPEAVKRIVLPIPEIGAAIHEKRASAALAIGPIGPGDAVDVVAAVAKAARGVPVLMAIDEGDAISKRFPGFESIDVPEGAFKAHPATPADSVKGLAITYRLAVPMTMLNAVAGAIGRSILKTKGKLMAVSPMAGQIEAPDPDEKNPVLPIHPGVAAYLSSGDQSFLDSAQQYLYVVGIPLSLAASLIAVLAGHWRNRKLQDDQQKLFQLLVIADQATKAEQPELDELQRELHATVASCVSQLLRGSNSANQWPVSLAIEHARRAIDARKAALRAISAQDAGKSAPRV